MTDDVKALVERVWSIANGMDEGSIVHAEDTRDIRALCTAVKAMPELLAAVKWTEVARILESEIDLPPHVSKSIAQRILSALEALSRDRAALAGGE